MVQGMVSALWVGGKEERIKKAEPILISLSVNRNGYVHIGLPVSGHLN